jgi:Flp pilus assembly protein TadG
VFRSGQSVNSREAAAECSPWRKPWVELAATDGAAIIEFAVSLPLLVVLVVGIFDFGGAFNTKQELNNAMREAAHFAASQPTNDLDSHTPPSVDAVRFLVDAYLLNAHLNDCGLSTVAQPSSATLVWKYSASNASCSLTLTISRGNPIQETVGGATVNMLSSNVVIVYPYQWHFNSVIQLLVPGANFALTNIQSDATAVNMN